MKLVTFESDLGERVGALLTGGGVLDLAAAAELRNQTLPTTMQALIEAGQSAWEIARTAAQAFPSGARLNPGSFTLKAPLPRPVRIRDCSLFLQHMEVAFKKLAETKAASEPDPKAALEKLLATGKYDLHSQFKQQVIYYNADHLHVNGPDEDILWPSYSTWMDYELEWACVVGPGARNITAADAHNHIFGYTIFNDWSARDVQLPFMECNLGPGEGKDFANSLGPCIVTPDEIADPYALAMTARVNGEIWSQGSTSTMHHRFEAAIVQFSRERALLPGEVIGSGTVLSGCGFELGRRLNDGDVVELEIQGIGTLRNRIVRRN